MRRLALILAALAILLAGCGGSHTTRPHFWLTPGHGHKLSACISSDCGQWSATLNWVIPPFPNTTGYDMFLNGTQIGSATSSPFTFYGSDCAASNTLGVRAHDGSGNHGPLWTTNYTSPACPIGGGPTNTAAPVIAWNVGETANTTVEGQTINVSTGRWSSTPTSFSYQWQRSPNGVTWSNIPGETEPIYTLHAANAPAVTDVGDVVRAQVTATNASGSTTTSSAATGTVTAVTGATTHYIADSGSDSNNGTSESTPWAHAPGMTGCTASCSSYTLHAGDQFIFRGGDTWDVNASAGVAGLSWNLANDRTLATATNRIYFGVDRSWFSGASWARPILSGDNPTSTAGGGNGVASCAVADPTNGIAFGDQDTTIDGFEFTGFCYTLTGSQEGHLIDEGGAAQKMLNLDFHGWTHAGTNGQSLFMIHGPPAGQGSNQSEIGYDVFNGFDTDTKSGTIAGFECYSYNHNYANDVINQVCNNGHDAEDNVWQNMTGDNSGSHSNTYELNDSAPGINLFYNNVVRNVNTGVVLWFAGPTTQNGDPPLYVYNNLLYNVGTGNYINCSSGTTTRVSCDKNSYINNTFEGSGAVSGDPIQYAGSNFLVGKTISATTTATNLALSEATANADGYTPVNQYAPTSGASPTVGTGTNRTDLCSTIPDLCSDTTLGVGIVNNNTLTFPARASVARSPSAAWGIGAYESP